MMKMGTSSGLIQLMFMNGVGLIPSMVSLNKPFSPFDESNMPDIEEMFSHFFNDSSINMSPFSNHFFGEPFHFDNDEFEHLMDQLKDSGMVPDSLKSSIMGQFGHELSPDDIMQHFHGFHPKFKNEAHQKEWMEMKKRHEQEMEDLLKKWGEE